MSGTAAAVPDVNDPELVPFAHEAVPVANVVVMPVVVLLPAMFVASNKNSCPPCSVIVEFDISMLVIGPLVDSGLALATLAVACGTVRNPTTMARETRTRVNRGLPDRILLLIV